MKFKGFIIALIVFLICLIAVLITFMVKVIKNGDFISFGHTVSKEKVIEEIYEEITDIKIDSNMADIVIKESNENNIKLVVYGDKDKSSAFMNNNVLNVKVRMKKCRGFCFNSKIAKVEISIPTTYKNKLVIYDDVGDIKIGNFKELVLKIVTDSGDIDIDNVNKANIKADTGDIDINKINDVTINTNVGDIKLGSVNKYLNIDTDTGNIKIEKANLTKNSKIKTDVGDVKIKSTNAYVDAKTDVGDIKIDNNNRKSEIELAIKTDVGDIKVK